MEDRREDRIEEVVSRGPPAQAKRSRLKPTLCLKTHSKPNAIASSSPSGSSSGHQINMAGSLSEPV